MYGRFRDRPVRFRDSAGPDGVVIPPCSIASGACSIVFRQIRIEILPYSNAIPPYSNQILRAATGFPAIAHDAECGRRGEARVF